MGRGGSGDVSARRSACVATAMACGPRVVCHMAAAAVDIPRANKRNCGLALLVASVVQLVGRERDRDGRTDGDTDA